MSEEQTPKRRGGWPKGKPRAAPSIVPDEAPEASPIYGLGHNSSMRPKAPASLLAKMKARPNWEGEDFAGVGLEGSDRLNIPAEIVNALHRDGVALQWVTHEVRGQEAPQELSKMTRGGWTPVHQSDFDGMLDGMFMPKGRDEVITVGDCMLVARPVEIHAKARMMERAEARRPLQIAEEQIGHGIPGVTGSDHPTATRGNHIKKSMERVEIPE